MNSSNIFDVCVLPGDGIGIEVTEVALSVLQAAVDHVGHFQINPVQYAAGAALYQQIGTAMPEEAWRAAEEADAIYLGAMGLPDIRYDDGTEIMPQLDLRFRFNLYAGLRPVSAKRAAQQYLSDARARDIDFVIIRESTEGLFASVGKGTVVGDREATDTLVITREKSEQLFEFAFGLARSRAGSARMPKVTLVDKANVFSSMAFFRKIFDEVAARHSDIETERLYVDACALDLVRRPWDFDVLVTENMFGDILSDLAAGLVGGMGFAPSADVGDAHAVFQPAHGSAPDIMGKGVANPTAAILSAAMLLDWLGRRHRFEPCQDAARKIEAVVEETLAENPEVIASSAAMGGEVLTRLKR
ncbi:MAG: isocitrate/isopropylmalate family dehydrogenase [Gammaproteobacteria bacterium]